MELIGGMLTGAEIERQISEGTISISDYDRSRLGPNSYNMRIGNRFKMYKAALDKFESDIRYLDSSDSYSLELVEFEIPDSGIILTPHEQYLVPTFECVHSDYFIPMLTGRSSAGRAGIQVHHEAGFGDIGFNGVWTLQITTVYPYILRPYAEISQVYFINPCGDINIKYNGKYQNATTAIGTIVDPSVHK